MVTVPLLLMEFATGDLGWYFLWNNFWYSSAITHRGEYLTCFRCLFKMWYAVGFLIRKEFLSTFYHITELCKLFYQGAKLTYRYPHSEYYTLILAYQSHRTFSSWHCVGFSSWRDVVYAVRSSVLKLLQTTSSNICLLVKVLMVFILTQVLKSDYWIFISWKVIQFL